MYDADIGGFMDIDPQLFRDGVTLASGHIQAGSRSFDVFSKAMIADIGEEIRPFLRSFYEAVRHYPGIDAVGMSPAAEIDQIEMGAQKNKAAWRRDVKPDRRARYGDMSPEELRQALEEKDRRMRNSQLTGLPNKLAYEESEKLPVQVFADIDGLKPINDNLGHDAGDSLIRAMADALANETSEVYHISGDEFYVQGNSLEEVSRIMEAARNTLMERGFTYLTADGVQVTKKGIGFSYGTANTIQQADANLQNDKAERKTLGFRSGERDADENSRLKGGGQAGGSDALDVVHPTKGISDRRADAGGVAGYATPAGSMAAFWPDFQLAEACSNGVYCGRIMGVKGGLVVQKVGRLPDDIVRHEVGNLSTIPVTDEIVEIKYKNGRGVVSESLQVQMPSIEL